MKNHQYIRRCSILLSLFLLALVLSACSLFNGRDPHEVVFWTTINDPITMSAQRHIITEFEKTNPDLHVKIVGVPTQGTNDATNMITAVRGGAPPDVYMIDRFTVSQQASIGLLTDLTSYMSTEKYGLANNYLPFSWQETLYQGHPYALPLGTDARGLYYNIDLLRQAGIDPDQLNPTHGPTTIEQIMRIATALNRTNAQGNYTQIGLIPWAGEGEHTTWALNFGAKFYDQQKCQITPGEPAILQTYKDFQKWAARLDYPKVDTFLATYQPPNAPPSQTPFFTGHLAMSIDGNWTLQSIQKYAPHLHYGVTYLPIEHKGDKPFTWSGGFALVMPHGALNPDGGYRFMKFMAGEEGQRIYTQETGSLPTWSSLLMDNELITGNQRFFAYSMQYSHSRPPLPVGAQLWDALTTAQQSVLLGNSTPEQATQQIYARVQPQMQQYCPFKLKQ